MKNSIHKIKYQKSPSAITAGVDGVFGGVAPQGKININFFVELATVPTEVRLQVDNVTGRVIKDLTEKEEVSNSVREVVASLNIDLETSKSLHIWLQQKIVELENLMKG